jgi:hypothetical protein
MIRVRVRPVRWSVPPQHGQHGSWCAWWTSMASGRGRAVPVWPGCAPRFLRRGWAVGLAYGGIDPEGVCGPVAGAGAPVATRALSWSSTKMAADRSWGSTASTCWAVNEPARNALTNAGSRAETGATGVGAVTAMTMSYKMPEDGPKMFSGLKGYRDSSDGM